MSVELERTIPPPHANPHAPRLFTPPANATVVPDATVPPNDQRAPLSSVTLPKFWYCVPKPLIVPADAPDRSSNVERFALAALAAPNTTPPNDAPGAISIRLPTEIDVFLFAASNANSVPPIEP